MPFLQSRGYITGGHYTVSGKQAQAHHSPRPLELPECLTLCRMSDTLAEPEPSRAKHGTVEAMRRLTPVKTMADEPDPA
jgi:hypothetical protein